MQRIWRHHSRTIVGLTIGSTMVLGARLTWPEGGADFDLVTLIGGILLGLGVQGILDHYLCEVADPKEP